MAKFLSELKIEEIDDKYSRLTDALIYDSDVTGFTIIVPAGFITDFSSVLRVPVVYLFWGGRCHREAVIHDYLYRIDSEPVVEREKADLTFLEAMEVRKKSFFVRYPMYFGVVVGGWTSYHKRKVMDKINEE